MASEDTRLGNEFKFQVGNGGSPTETFADFCAVSDPGAIGEEKALIDVTALCDEARTYRGGLPDGVTIPLKCNFIQGDTAIRHMYESYQQDSKKNYRLALDDTSPSEYFEFAAIVTAWNLAIPVGDKASVTFSLKISGIVTWVYGG
jgi:hypothetical protein